MQLATTIYKCLGKRVMRTDYGKKADEQQTPELSHHKIPTYIREDVPILPFTQCIQKTLRSTCLIWLTNRQIGAMIMDTQEAE